MRFGSDHQGAQQDQGCAEPLEFGVSNLRMAGATHSHRIHGAAIYGDIYHQYTPNVSIYAIHGSYGIGGIRFENLFLMMMEAHKNPNPS